MKKKQQTYTDPSFLYRCQRRKVCRKSFSGFSGTANILRHSSSGSSRVSRKRRQTFGNSPATARKTCSERIFRVKQSLINFMMTIQEKPKHKSAISQKALATSSFFNHFLSWLLTLEMMLRSALKWNEINEDVRKIPKA